MSFHRWATYEVRQQNNEDRNENANRLNRTTTSMTAGIRFLFNRIISHDYYGCRVRHGSLLGRETRGDC